MSAAAPAAIAARPRMSRRCKFMGRLLLPHRSTKPFRECLMGSCRDCLNNCSDVKNFCIRKNCKRTRRERNAVGNPRLLVVKPRDPGVAHEKHRKRQRAQREDGKGQPTAEK